MIKILEYDQLDSTNDEAKRLVRAAKNNGPAEQNRGDIVKKLYGSVITARRQNAGRGRMGKSFFSPGGDCIYASFILPLPERPAEQLITAAAAVAVCEALENTTAYKPGIKWVNDIIVGGKKVCGILAETIPEAVILGIGVNINIEDGGLPKELQGIAGSLRMSEKEKDDFFSALAEKVPFYVSSEKTGGSSCAADKRADKRDGSFCPASDISSVINAYRKRSVIIGKSILVVQGDKKRPAAALGIADDGALIVKYEDGSTENLRAGEISVMDAAVT